MAGRRRGKAKGRNKKPKGLTANQKRFVEEYVIDRNATQAYFRAYGRAYASGKKRSYFVAAESARRLLQKPEVKREIAAAINEQSRRCRVSADRVLRGDIIQAYVDPLDAYDLDDQGQMTPKPLHEIPVHVRQQIEGVKIKRRRVKDEDGETVTVEEIEYRFAGKNPARDRLSRHLGLTKDGAGSDALLAALRAAVGNQAVGAVDGAPSAPGQSADGTPDAGRHPE